jgi:hypothetical protein
VLVSVSVSHLVDGSLCLDSQQMNVLVPALPPGIFAESGLPIFPELPLDLADQIQRRDVVHMLGDSRVVGDARRWKLEGTDLSLALFQHLVVARSFSLISVYLFCLLLAFIKL